MARGSPDFWGQGVFNKFGAFHEAYEADVLASGDVTDLLTIEGKGRIYGGHLNIFSAVSLQLDKIYVTVDGVVSAGTLMGNMLNDRLYNQPLLAFSLLRYDTDHMEITVLIGENVVYESSFILQYDAKTADNRTWNCQITYADLL